MKQYIKTGLATEYKHMEAIINCNADLISTEQLTELLPIPNSKSSVSVIGIYIMCYNSLPADKRDGFLQQICAKGLNLNDAYSLKCPEDDCDYSVNPLSHALGSDWIDLRLHTSFSPDLLRVLLKNGADVNGQYVFTASDNVTSLKGSVLLIALRKGNQAAANILLEHGARFDQKTDIAPLSSAMVCSPCAYDTLYSFLVYFKKGQITLRDVQAADPVTGENALQIHAQQTCTAAFPLNLGILITSFQLNPAEGGPKSAIQLARDMADTCRRLSLLSDARWYDLSVEEMQKLAV